MKTQTVKVQTGDRISEFVNHDDAVAYARKWGGEIVAGNEGDGVAGIGVFKGPPVYHPGIVAGLGLPAGASDTEFEAAWEANGCQVSVLHTAKVLEAMIQLAMRQKSMSRPQATDYCRNRFPKLFPSELRGVSGQA